MGLSLHIFSYPCNRTLYSIPHITLSSLMQDPLFTSRIMSDLRIGIKSTHKVDCIILHTLINKIMHSGILPYIKTDLQFFIENIESIFYKGIYTQPLPIILKEGIKLHSIESIRTSNEYFEGRGMLSLHPELHNESTLNIHYANKILSTAVKDESTIIDRYRFMQCNLQPINIKKVKKSLILTCNILLDSINVELPQCEIHAISSGSIKYVGNKILWRLKNPMKKKYYCEIKEGSVKAVSFSYGSEFMSYSGRTIKGLSGGKGETWTRYKIEGVKCQVLFNN